MRKSADIPFKIDWVGFGVRRLVPSADGKSAVERPLTDSERERFRGRFETEGNLLSEEEAISLALEGTY